MTTIVMAGGRGTRIASIEAALPKPMIPIMGKPVLEYQIEGLKRQGLTQFIFVIGHMGDAIRQYFGDGSGISPATGRPFGVQISYFAEKEPLGTAGALYFLDKAFEQDVLLVNGDIIFDVDIHRLTEYHRAKQALVTLVTHPNDHPYDSAVLETDADGRVTGWLHKESVRGFYENRVNAGIHLLSPGFMNACRERLHVFLDPLKTDLDRDVLKPLVTTGQIYAYDTPEYIKDMGVPERYYSVSRDVEQGKLADRCLEKKQKALFLDRDGTINRLDGFITDIDRFELLEGAAEAVRRINESGFLSIIATNQPVLARGDITHEELCRIHMKMQTLLGEKGAYLDAVYFCPHHPDRGFEGEIPELKTACSCRKPGPGMLLEAAGKYNIDLSASWMIGDSDTDMAAGRAAGCRTAGVYGCKSGELNFDSLSECVEAILETESRESGKTQKPGEYSEK